MDTALTTPIVALGNSAVGISAAGFDEIIRQRQRKVYQVIFVLLRDADAAATLTQECFLRAYRNRNSFRGECRLDTWLLRIAVNLVRDYGKNRRISFWKRLVAMNQEEVENGTTLPFVAPQASAERVLLAREELEAVWTAADSLSPQQRTVFLLRYAEEMSLGEIAETLMISLGTVKAQLCRATGKVRGMVKEQSCK